MVQTHHVHEPLRWFLCCSSRREENHMRYVKFPTLFCNELISKIGTCGRCIRTARNAALASLGLTALLLFAGPAFGFPGLLIMAVSISAALGIWLLINTIVFVGRNGLRSVENFHRTQAITARADLSHKSPMTRRDTLNVFLRAAGTALVVSVGVTAGTRQSLASCCYCAQYSRSGKCICWRRSPGCTATCICQ